jgi:hypothetical protein
VTRKICCGAASSAAVDSFGERTSRRPHESAQDAAAADVRPRWSGIAPRSRGAAPKKFVRPARRDAFEFVRRLVQHLKPFPFPIVAAARHCEPAPAPKTRKSQYGSASPLNLGCSTAGRRTDSAIRGCRGRARAFEASIRHQGSDRAPQIDPTPSCCPRLCLDELRHYGQQTPTRVIRTVCSTDESASVARARDRPIAV